LATNVFEFWGFLAFAISKPTNGEHRGVYEVIFFFFTFSTAVVNRALGYWGKTKCYSVLRGRAELLTSACMWVPSPLGYRVQ